MPRAALAAVLRALCVGLVLLFSAQAQTTVRSQADLTAAFRGSATAIIVGSNITLTSALPILTRTLSITGDPAACSPGLCTVNGSGLFRIFEVYTNSSAVTLTLNTLGLVSGSDAADNKGGGAVLLLPGTSPNWPALVVSGCVFQGNVANGIGPGGAIAANAAAVVAANIQMTITNSLFVANTAYTMAGAVFAYGTTVVSGSSFVSNGVAFPGTQLSNSSLGSPGSNGLGFGGGLALGTCTTGTLSVSGSSFTSNWATNGGGLLCGPACACNIQSSTFTNNTASGAFLVGGVGVAGDGGAVAAFPGASLVIGQSTFTSNVAGNEGGAVFMSGTKQGSVNYALGGLFGFAGHSSFAATSAAAVFALAAGQAAPAVAASPVNATITGCTVTGSTAITGGGIYLEGAGAALILTNTVLTSTSASKKGGGIYMVSSSNVTLTNVSITGGFAGVQGGCLDVGATSRLVITGGAFTSCSTLGLGGGLYIDANTSAIVNGTSFVNNSAVGYGGGIYAFTGAQLSATNLQLSSNSAVSGGAVAVAQYANATLTSCAFSQNSASASGGALLASGAAAVTVQSGTFTSNTVTGLAPRGGAAALEDVASVTLAGCSFASNVVTAVLPAAPVVGLVQQLEYAGTQTAGAVFLGTAPLAAGGGPMTASISSSAFQGNIAPGAGGALMALAQCPIALTMSACTLSLNTAGGAGGALALSGAVTATLSGGIYSSNTAGSDGGAAALLDGSTTTSSGGSYTANAALTGRGGAMLLQASVGASTQLSGETMSGNAALYGGALAISGAAHALAVASTPASTFTSNAATYGGVFSLSAAGQPPQLLLAGATLSGNLASVGAVFFSDAAVGQLGCPGCTLSNNNASNYGSVSAANPAGVATPPVAFALAAPATVTTGGLCGVNISMTDAYQNVISAWPGFAASLMPASQISGSLLAGSYIGGSSALANAAVNAAPSSNLTITVSVTSPALGTANISLQIAQCGVNEVFQALTVTCECTRGTFQPVGSPNPCTICPAGTFAAGIGEVACASCAASAVSLPGSTACLTCPDFSRPVTDSLCMCEANYYGLFSGTNNGTCTICPANAVCQGGYIVADQGYWKSSSGSVDIQQCLEPEACTFGNRTQTLMTLALSGASESSLLAAQCWPSYRGPLCSQCSAGYGRDTDIKCGQCPSFKDNTGQLAASSLSNIASVIVTIRSNMHGGVSPPLHSQIIKVMLNYLTVASLASRAPLKWPQRISEMMSVQATATHSGGKVVAIECSLPQRDRKPKFYDLVSGYLILVPVAALVIPVVFWVLWYLGKVRSTVALQQRWASSAADWARENEGPAFKLEGPAKADEAPMSASFLKGFLTESYIHYETLRPLKKDDLAYEAYLTSLTAAAPFGDGDHLAARRLVKSYGVISIVVLLFYLWTPVTSTILHLFVCVEIDPQTPSSPFHGLFLQQDTTEVCWHGRHRDYLLSGALVSSLLVVLGIPIGSGVYLWRNRHRLKDPDMNLRWGFIYYGYTADACYYESVIMLRKLVLVTVTVFFNHGDPNAGAFVLCIMLGTMFVSFFLHAQVLPYEEPILDHLEKLSMYASIITLWIGLFFFMGTPHEAQVVLTLVLVFVNAAMCVTFVACIASEFIHGQVLAGMPPGSTRVNVKAKAIVDHVIFHNWPRVNRISALWKRKLYSWILMQFIRWLDSRKRSVKELEEYIPTLLHEMRSAADAAERKRRGEAIAQWAAAGLIHDPEIAAWVCWYEGEQRDPATLSLLVERTLQRERDLASLEQPIVLPGIVLTPAAAPSLVARLLGGPLRPPLKNKQLRRRRSSKAHDVEHSGGYRGRSKAYIDIVEQQRASALEAAPPPVDEEAPATELAADRAGSDARAPAATAKRQKKKRASAAHALPNV